MKKIIVRNPFDAPVFFMETVTSTMDISRQLAHEGQPHGTVITANYQEKGRGRIHERSWNMERNTSLAFTVLLRYSCIKDIPSALTLRSGLAVSLAVVAYANPLQGLVTVKWPNDIMLGCKKAAGILCEADGGNVHLGIGINVRQKEFPDHLKEKATSIALASGLEITQDARFLLLEKILEKLHDELKRASANDWKKCLEQLLYKKGESVVFTEGAADSCKTINGILTGIGDSGELLILPHGETQIRSFFSGELKYS
jgi:BirA family biotin operon repressor/biotin-[acetyl-CoA-carboxylase] ligase